MTGTARIVRGDALHLPLAEGFTPTWMVLDELDQAGDTLAADDLPDAWMNGADVSADWDDPDNPYWEEEAHRMTYSETLDGIDATLAQYDRTR